MGLLKSKDEKAAIKFDKGSDLIAQKKFDEAKANLEKSIKKGNTSPEVFVLREMLQLRPHFGDQNALKSAIKVFSQYPDTQVKYGVYDIDTSKLLNECKLRLEAEEVLGDRRISIESGKAILQTANKYSSEIGDEALLMEEIFNEDKVTGREYSNILFALGYEKLSEAVKWDDPKKAAEYQQQALIYNRDRKDDVRVAANEAFVAGVSKTVHCWFCGKEVTGSDIHFVPMPSQITQPILNQAQTDAPVPTNDHTHLYACRACFSAIDLQDQAYLKSSMEYTDNEVTNLANLVAARINDLQEQINDLRSAFNRSR